MRFLDCLQAYAKKDEQHGAGTQTLRINLITNFTDEPLERVLGGMCLLHGIYPVIVRAPYKQYAGVLKDIESPLYRSKPDISFIFFDINPYMHGALHAAEHVEETLADLEHYARSIETTVVVSLCPLPYTNPHGQRFHQDEVFKRAETFTHGVHALARTLQNIYIVDTNMLMHQLGEGHARDVRGAYAFDLPFTSDFLFLLAQEWYACIQAITGRSKKCIVLDLDTTLWGGIVGEAGPLGIALGPDYPGIAYVNFQRALLGLWAQGVLLAINSKNNLADVQEVFEKKYAHDPGGRTLRGDGNKLGREKRQYRAHSKDAQHRGRQHGLHRRFAAGAREDARRAS